MSDVTLPGSVGSEPVLTSHWLTWPRFIADLMSGLGWLGGARPRICCTAYSLPRRPRARSSASSCVRWSRPSSASDQENSGLTQQPLSTSRVEQEMEVTDDILFTSLVGNHLNSGGGCGGAGWVLAAAARVGLATRAL